ncbi:hypothetical protein J2Z47_001795, partial [Cohnella thailandensis]|nr:hypothetical protein [Cohnella thailandensis]
AREMYGKIVQRGSPRAKAREMHGKTVQRRLAGAKKEGPNVHRAFFLCVSSADQRCATA